MGSTSLGSEGGGGGGGGGWEDGTGAAEGQFPDDEPPLKRSRKRTKQVRCSVDMLLGPLAPGERAGMLTIACPCQRAKHSLSSGILTALVCRACIRGG